MDKINYISGPVFVLLEGKINNYIAHLEYFFLKKKINSEK